MQWKPSSWKSRPSEYTNLSQLSLSNDRSIDSSLQSADTPHTAGFAIPKASHDREESCLQQVAGLAASQSTGASSKIRDTNLTPSGATNHSTSESDQYHQSPSHQRSRSSVGSVEESGLPSGALGKDSDGPSARTWDGRNGQRSSPNESAVLNYKTQEISQAILSDITNGVMKGEEIESAIKDHVKNILHNSISSSRNVGQAASTIVPRSTEKRYKCDQCPKTVKRHCDLKYVSNRRDPSCQVVDCVSRKHKKRHTRPYGCTYTTCLRRFGSKNDWKRHENTQHYQIEAWRCQEPSSASKINQCAKVFYRREQYQAHLKDHHHVKDEGEIRKRSQKNRIGRNGQSGFWCGFCRKIVTLTTKGLEAWDERFDHIDRQHFNKEMTIDQWYPLDKDFPLGEMLPSDSVNTAPTPAADEDDSEGEDSSDEADQDDSPTSAEGEEPQVQASQNSKRTHITVTDEERSSKRQARERMWYCVSGPLNKHRVRY